MTYRFDGLNLVLRFATEIDYDRAARALSVKHPAAAVLKRRNRNNPFYRNWDGMVSYLKPSKWRGPDCDYVCPHGYAERLAALFETTMKLSPVHTAPFSQLLLDKTLSPEQEKVCRLLLSRRLVSAQFKTGSGKTEVMMNAIACLLPQTKTRFLVLVPLKRLLSQTIKRFTEGLRDGNKLIGIAGDSKLDLDSRRIVIGIPNTVAKLDHPWLSGVTHVICDEAHHSSSDLWRKAIAGCSPDAIWGLSGKLSFDRAPNRQREFELEGLLGPVQIESEAAERRVPVIVRLHKPAPDSWAPCPSVPAQVRDGVAVAFKLRGATTWSYGKYRGLDLNGKPNRSCLREDHNGKLRPDKSLFGIYARDGKSWRQVSDSEIEPNTVVYRIAYDVGAMEYAPANQWAVELAKACAEAGEPWLMTVQKVRHLNTLHQLLTNANVSAEILHGTLSDGAQRLERFTSGRVSGLVATQGCVSEGLDIPDLRHFIKLDRMAGEQLLTQQEGRVARIAPGKERAFIHLSADPQLPSLATIARRAVQYYREIGLKAEVVQH